MSDELAKIKAVLGKLIAWLARELGENNATALLHELYPESTGEADGQEREET
jgi:hypothetical protein